MIATITFPTCCENRSGRLLHRGTALREFLARLLSRSRIAIRLAWRPERRAALRAARQRRALIAALRNFGHRTLRDIGLGDD